MKIEQLTNLKNVLPVIPGIQGKQEYFNSVVLVLLMPIAGEYHFVFQKRCSKIRQGGEICFPGGKHEKENDGTLERTAIRETVEEMGIPIEKINIIGQLDTIVAPMGATVDVFIGVTTLSVEKMKFNQEEVETVFSIPISYFEKYEIEQYQVMIKVHPSYIDGKNNQEIVLFPAKELNLPEKYHTPWGEFKYGVFVFKTDFGIIWGITSRIIYEIINKLKS